MASANVELVQSIYDAWEKGDFSSAEWAHPEIEFVAVGGSDPGRWVGLSDMTETVRSRLSVWEAARVKAEHYRELDNGRVVVFFSIRGRGKSSGLELGQMAAEGVSVWHLRDGTVMRLVLYWDRDRAFVDLGLDPEGDAAPRLSP